MRNGPATYFGPCPRIPKGGIMAHVLLIDDDPAVSDTKHDPIKASAVTTAAIELLLPTYDEKLGLRGKIRCNQQTQTGQLSMAC
jgi:hypothetical protein